MAQAGLEASQGVPDVYAAIASKLGELIEDVREVTIDDDKQRELLTLIARDRVGTEHTARALSDGTLRFLALAVISMDPSAQGVLCLEEPENGIHPTRIPAMLRLLRDIATDPKEPVGPDNPLRQVIVNTHSPVVVSEVPDDTLIVAQSREVVRDGRRYPRVHFACLPDTWRDVEDEGGKRPEFVTKGTLLEYLSPVTAEAPTAERNGHRPRPSKQKKPRRVIDRPDMKQLLFGFGDDEV